MANYYQTGTQMKTFKTNGHDEQVTAGNGGNVALESRDAEETDDLLEVQIASHNGEGSPFNYAAEHQRNRENSYTPQESCMSKVKRELNDIVFWKVRLWMIIVFLFPVIITAVVVMSMAICSALYKDPDENFDPSLFKVPLSFNGSFQLPNQVFTEELLSLSSNESQALATNFEEKIADLYRSSTALGRYFSQAEIVAFRNRPVVADYQLTFVMPEEEQDQLRNFILSREMVYNVFRQFLYDQESDDSQPMYIDPVSLIMHVRH